VFNHILESWSAIYADSGALRTGVAFMHISGLVAGGGCAITADLATITAARAKSPALVAQLRLLKRTHAIVVLGLAAIVVSGILLVAADVETFVASRLFWLKMGLMAVLLANGVLLVRSEKAATHAHAEARAWRRLHRIATASLVLWALTTLAGAALPNLG
jgi:hypothetical protein